MAPTLLAYVYRQGRSAKVEIQEWLRAKQLETCHAACEMLLLAVILDNMVMDKTPTSHDMINQDSVEIIARRMYGVYRAFERVKSQSDWKAPKGQPGQKWKTEVVWHLADEYDVLAMQNADIQIDEADDEVRKRLERKALFAKHLDKATEHGAFGELHPEWGAPR